MNNFFQIIVFFFILRHEFGNFYINYINVLHVFFFFDMMEVRGRVVLWFCVWMDSGELVTIPKTAN
ncbi:hypothetical protein SAMN04487936_101388 [Halobacillus dabanensis]|uniref:Uncharacterized protein n=1 Tax=Halobacillus dabanensis TaxID=240302 RepID=A0A1I3PNS5_HALDA|nr:hypothetical protein SAMN04487936_101388 [Halobacillus dabanensis]